jgi:hypothetical protein
MLHGCCYETYPHLVDWESVGEDTVRSYSACLYEISQNSSRKIKKIRAECKKTELSSPPITLAVLAWT